MTTHANNTFIYLGKIITLVKASNIWLFLVAKVPWRLHRLSMTQRCSSSVPVSKWPNADKWSENKIRTVNAFWQSVIFGPAPSSVLVILERPEPPQQVPSIFSKGKLGIRRKYFFLAFENYHVIGWKRRVGGVNAEVHKCCLFHCWLNRWIGLTQQLEQATRKAEH